MTLDREPLIAHPEGWMAHDFILIRDNLDHSKWVCRLCGEVEWRVMM